MVENKQFVNYNEKLPSLIINNNTCKEIILRKLMYFALAISLLGSFGIGWGISGASLWEKLSNNNITKFNYNMTNLIVSIVAMILHGIYLKITLYGYKKIERLDFYKRFTIFSLSMTTVHLLIIIITFWYVIRIHVNNFYIAGLLTAIIAVAFIYTLIFLFYKEVKRQWKLKKYIDYRNEVKKFKRSEEIQYYSKEQQLIDSKIGEFKKLDTNTKKDEWYKLSRKEVLKNKKKLKNDKIK